ncbi:MAG TPA: hypothetical protein VGL20_10975 [Candidatus Dormibacteraeota bacterium]|jgi:hypothetical protein
MPTSSAGEETARRPTALLLVYTWDMVRGILALFGAITAFGADVIVHGRTVHVSVLSQVLAALASASLAAALFVVGTLLTRRRAWVRRAQIVLLLMDVALAVVSVAVDEITAHAGLDLPPLLGVALFALIDLCAVTAMTGPRIAAWYREPGPVPLHVGGLIAFWAATSVAFVALRALS